MLLQLSPSWAAHLGSELDKPYYRALESFVNEAYASTECYPPRDKIGEAFRLCPWEAVKVVILGQDPYHEPGQAMGLSFSVPAGVKLPPSLRNIYKEVTADTGKVMPESGDLTRWASQGVLLLNATLTVERGKAGSHAHKGWEQLTDAAIHTLSSQREGLVFLLWGNYARQKRLLIDAGRHLILESAHPSPLSAWQGFFGNHQFTRANAYLEAQGKTSIDW